MTNARNNLNNSTKLAHMIGADFLPRLNVLRCGVHFKHPPDFVVERPHGSGDWVWVQFLSPVYLRDKNGFRRLQAGAHILHSPDFPHWYSGVDNAMEAHWMHFAGADVEPLLNNCKLEINQALMPEPNPIFTTLITALEREQSRNELFQNEVSTLLATQLIFELARALKNNGLQQLTSHQQALRETLQNVRLTILREPQKSWTVKSMAELTHLSPSRFAALYREFFGVTPMEEVLRGRMERACWLLLNTDALVARVAEECGFESTAHFSRTFTRRMGCPPSRYYLQAPKG